ncbi:peptidase M20 [Paenibacillus sp. J31TS4]|uniref:M20 metallopeptidase family protein n=1 Tax=Paenibacillus sp. J31TS4 TaxID=2807195 RepID=UPI001B1364BF|nr:M20 family metallopeptidase [Paenibacillus sp. J31TS4]GIP40212.1 peptidase M20 [Paenibacillus sp. J31TS4]
MEATITLEWVEANLEAHLIQMYKHLHQHPELSTQEVETQAFILRELDRLNIPRKIMATTGVCAEIRGGRPGKTVLLRADIDALPIGEQTGLPYASRKEGVMHACGHDAHTVVGLGVAAALQERAADLAGTVKIMFQPSEEVHPGGATRMIQEGILENPRVDAAIGIHTNPYLPAGKLGLKDGYILANSDRIYISLIGKGGHASAPDQGIDAIAMAGQFLTGLQAIVSRQLSPFDNAVITIGTISGGYTANAIADRVDLAGTVRTLTAETRDRVQAKLESLLQAVAGYWGGTFTHRYERGYPATWNDKAMTDTVRAAAAACFGEDSIIELEHGYMSGDDFAYLAQAVPSVFIEWGTGTEGEESFAWHHPKFRVNLESLKYGVAVTAQSIVGFLEDGVREG